MTPDLLECCHEVARAAWQPPGLDDTYKGGVAVAQRTCMFPGCEVDARGPSGFCRPHYLKLWRRGALPSRPAPASLPGEEWRAVVGYEGWYEVSDHGRVRRASGSPGVAVGRLLIGWQPRDDYRRVLLHRNGQRRIVFVHRLVTAAFLGPLPEGHEVNHRDGDKANNQVGNLEYGTHSYNQQHAYRIGLHPGWAGERAPSGKLTEQQVAEIRRRYRPYIYGCERLARDYGVCNTTIHRIVTGKTWRLP